ncbi:MAG: hypothetical protein FWD57_07555 [Polyangiaceae bacterium]|nr:hypothetical protein [Polyangiaceae bacterium]
MSMVHKFSSCLAIGALLVVALGCQSRNEAIRLLCDLPNEKPVSTNTAQTAQTWEEYLDRAISNREIRLKVREIADVTVPPSGKGRIVRDLATSANLPTCALADFYGQMQQFEP